MLRLKISEKVVPGRLGRSTAPDRHMQVDGVEIFAEHAFGAPALIVSSSTSDSRSAKVTG